MKHMTLFNRCAGKSSASLLFSALMTIAGCHDGSAMTEPAEATILLRISGVMTPQYQSIRVASGGVPVMDANVTVNGVSIPHYAGDLYSGSLPAAIPAGGTLNLKVVAGRVNFQGSGEVLATPVITAPAAGSTFASTDHFSLAWSVPTDPDRFEVCLNCWLNSLDARTYSAPGSSRAFSIAPGALADYGTGAVVAVSAFKNNFLKSAGSPSVASNVLFNVGSRAVINITY